MIRQLLFYALMLAIAGCGGASEATSRSPATPLSEAEVELAQAELKTFSFANGTTSPHIELRQAWLRSQIVSSGYEFPNLPEDTLQWPAGDVWIDPEDPDREQCRNIRDELVALAGGRGMAGTWPAIQARVQQLQSLLSAGGYDFDDNGWEATYTDEGDARSDYTALGDQFGDQ